MTKIQWVKNQDGTQGETWNPLVGCKKTSPGCANCYAESMAKRLKAMGVESYQDVVDDRGWTGKIALVESALDKPKKKKKPTVYFVNSMSDLFHKDVPLEFIKKVFQVMNDNPQHTFQVLTKRHDRLESISHELTWTKNIWMGVSVESQQYVERIESLKKTDACVKFLSCEPLLSDLDMDLDGIHWVIVGGESGPRFREIKQEWIENILSQCQSKNIPFFFKQWSGYRPSTLDRKLNGLTYDEMPVIQS